jgi:cytochrome b6
VQRWLEERYDLEPIRHLLKKKAVPLHRHSIWYYFGGMTLFLFGLQVATGILLLLYYRPSEQQAFESVQFLVTKVPFGWLIRSIHSWSANLLIFFVFLHMFSAYLLKSYRSPREMTWVTGVFLFFILLGFGFSGYLLPWNELAFFATKVGTDITGAVPVIGDFMLRFMRGGRHVTGGTLTRFFGLHVAVLPAMTTVVLGLHLYLIQQQGMSVPPRVEARARKEGRKVPEMPFLPHFLLRDMLGWFAALAVLASLAALFPWELGVKADPFAPAPAGIRPEWYFLFMFQTLKYLPANFIGIEGEQVGIIGFGLAGLFWLLVPFLDRSVSRKPVGVAQGEQPAFHLDRRRRHPVHPVVDLRRLLALMESLR